MSTSNVPLHAKSVDDASSVISAVDKAADRLRPSGCQPLLLRPAEFDLVQRNRLALQSHIQLSADIQLSPS
jgi:hypothetical protein